MENNMRNFKIPVVLIFIFYFVYGESPTEKGTWNISGEMYYSYTKRDGGNDRKYLYFSPGSYYFVHKNIAVGANLSYARLWYDIHTVDYYTINPGIRLYLLTGEKIFPFLLSSFSCYWADYHGGDMYIIYDMNYGFGVDIFISKNVALEPYFTYHRTQHKGGDSILDKQKIFETGVSLAIFIF